MIYPDNFEKKIGFDEIRTLLKGRCISTLGTEWVDNKLTFMKDFDLIKTNLMEAKEMDRFLTEEDDCDIELNFFDIRQALMRIKPERTHMEELELFDLKRALKTIVDFTDVLDKGSDEDEEEEGDNDDASKETSTRYPALKAMMSGSGPTVFGVFDDRSKLRKATEVLRSSHLAKTVFATQIYNKK